jgi:hypothetical protein
MLKFIIVYYKFDYNKHLSLIISVLGLIIHSLDLILVIKCIEIFLSCTYNQFPCLKTHLNLSLFPSPSLS